MSTTSLKRLMHALGLDVRRSLNNARALRQYRANRRDFMRQPTDWNIGEDWPCLSDRFDSGGVASGQYFHQDLYVAQQIFRARPNKHVDAGSRVDGFVAHIASFMPVEFLDIRPLESSAENISFTQRDLMTDDHSFDDYTDSLSCLHTLEHLGLGRYGDSICADGYLRGWVNLTRMVCSGGVFYFSVPISRSERIEYDAHRLFGVPRLLEMIELAFEIEAVAVVGDDNQIRRNLDPASAEAQRSYDVNYGCAIFRACPESRGFLVTIHGEL
ncbi:DUF268 domain-containing protein [Mycolicibacterium vanbaalenii]|uniref:DUF268 domain-containing protein n=1 Tax=Mycolicibacterium vanbaalenii TaxID=110539 RepID=UPI001F36F8BE|nr:DUF268 domain-containing protein [Mycolicibacterium vanbaalenii]UJL31480.1 DUF268 domain-containing protein [Mycolicibacterium vanbaalenii]WND58327.1 DUF268 domain-containing protein [Mycolicibacterium vanbaalenii]